MKLPIKYSNRPVLPSQYVQCPDHAQLIHHYRWESPGSVLKITGPLPPTYRSGPGIFPRCWPLYLWGELWGNSCQSDLQEDVHQLRGLYLPCSPLHSQRQDRLPLSFPEFAWVVLRCLLHPRRDALCSQPSHIRCLQSKLQKVMHFYMVLAVLIWSSYLHHPEHIWRLSTVEQLLREDLTGWDHWTEPPLNQDKTRTTIRSTCNLSYISMLQYSIPVIGWCKSVSSIFIN